MRPLRYATVQIVIWTATISLSLLFYYQNQQKQVLQLAHKEAITILNKDISVRNWASRHGGVYVPPTAETLPNPYLNTIVERDVQTVSGKRLTLMNPAYMLRQVQEDFSTEYGIKGHLTSLKLMNPNNKADDWEIASLLRFEQGQSDVSETTTIEGSSFLRVMVPMVTQKGCLKCHGEQGYQVGEVRGGVSVTVPLTPYEDMAAKVLLPVVAMHSVIWLLGLLGIGLFAQNQLRGIREREESSVRLNNALGELEDKVNERTAELAQTNEILRQDIEERGKAEKMLLAANRELELAYKEIKQTQSQLLQREKMASIGQLAAGVAHEINNPVGYIRSNLSTLVKYLERFAEYVTDQQTACADLPEKARQTLMEKAKKLKIDRISADAKNLVSECLEGTDRVREIVTNLKNFSRVDHPEEQPASVNTCLDETLRIVWNELKYKAEVVKDYGELPTTLCHPQQLNQVFVNILVNAAQAMVDKGKIVIRTWLEAGKIFVAISDNGPGIPEEIRNRLFEPFFTTKEVGKGTGLGLSISYDIIKNHGGEISITSEMGRGTTFTIQIPVREPVGGEKSKSKSTECCGR